MDKKYKYEVANVILKQGNLGKYPLLLGDAQASTTNSILKKYEIGIIISIGQEAAPKKTYPNIKYHSIKLRDQKDQPIADLFETVTSLIEESRNKCAVLIHCYHGVSRSASFVIAYLIRKKGLSMKQAFKEVKEQRSCISPNQGFVKQLELFAQSNPKFKQELQQ